MDPQPDRQKVLWWGPRSDSLGWLHDRCGDWCRGNSSARLPLRFCVIDDFDELHSNVTHDCQRIILACENRWDYPDDAVRRMVSEYPEIPLAVALSEWWLGWRRTGIGHFGPTDCLCLPWFRWWDGWMPWLAGTSPAMLGPFPSRVPSRPVHDFLRLSQDSQQTVIADQDLPKALGINATPKTAIVIGSCNHSVQAWLQILRRDGRWDAANEQDLVGFNIQESRLPDQLHGPADPDIVLWDDTRLSTFLGPDRDLMLAVDELTELAQRYPASRLWVAWNQPTWNLVKRLQRARLGFELLGKPYFGSFSSAALARR